MCTCCVQCEPVLCLLLSRPLPAPPPSCCCSSGAHCRSHSVDLSQPSPAHPPAPLVCPPHSTAGQRKESSVVETSVCGGLRELTAPLNAARLRPIQQQTRSAMVSRDTCAAAATDSLSLSLSLSFCLCFFISLSLSRSVSVSSSLSLSHSVFVSSSLSLVLSLFYLSFALSLPLYV